METLTITVTDSSGKTTVTKRQIDSPELSKLSNRIRNQRLGNWPMILVPMKLLAKSGDKGLGDIVARTVGPLGGEEFKLWYKKIFGKDCGCNARQEAWNEAYPL